MFINFDDWTGFERLQDISNKKRAFVLLYVTAQSRFCLHSDVQIGLTEGIFSHVFDRKTQTSHSIVSSCSEQYVIIQSTLDVSKSKLILNYCNLKVNFLVLEN